MKKIRFIDDVLPHVVAISAFFIVTLFFFNPVFFDNKVLVQHDIQQATGSSKSISDYRNKTGEEALWAESSFSGMPAYLVSVQWSTGPVSFIKKVLSIGITHPVSNIFCSFVCFYILLLVFGVRPYLAIGGALAFGLSSYVIIGLMAGHNARVGAIAFLPLTVAGIHLAFSGRRMLGLAVTAAGMALHLRENHLQITFYLVFIVAIYGIIKLIEAIKSKSLVNFGKTLGVLVIGVTIGAFTSFGQFWAISEYSPYSTRGKSDLAGLTPQQQGEASLGMSREYAFEFSNGILEPLTLLIPNIYGGSSSNYFFMDQKSKSYNALVSAGNQQTANQLAQYTSAYWGEQRLSAPYYAGAVIVFLAAVGVAFADKKYKWWLISTSILGIVFSWGSNFASLNYFLFDHFPGFNKFRSVTFALIMPLFAMPLLGMLGVENLLKNSIDKTAKRKLLIAFAATGGLCLLLIVFAGIFSFMKNVEAQLPSWFTDALVADRKSALRSDAFRSFAFIAIAFLALYFDMHKRLSAIGFFALLGILIVIDVSVVDKRYLTKDNFEKKRSNTFFTMTESDEAILQDKSYYRVYNLGDNPFAEARTSYYFNSVGGYSGAKLRRYADFYDSCLIKQTQQFITSANQGQIDFKDLSAFNMLNIKYVQFGPKRNNFIENKDVYGPAWFVKSISKATSPADELEKTCTVNTKEVAVIDGTQFTTGEVSSDSLAGISLKEHSPRHLQYESNSSVNGMAVFSEIFYPKGWIATIDGKEAPITRADYILRALQIPAGKHTIDFRFEPKPYVMGNKVTLIASWLTLILLIAGIVVSVKEDKRVPIN
jgi:hypothetical protein